MLQLHHRHLILLPKTSYVPIVALAVADINGICIYLVPEFEASIRYVRGEAALQGLMAWCVKRFYLDCNTFKLTIKSVKLVPRNWYRCRQFSYAMPYIPCRLSAHWSLIKYSKRLSIISASSYFSNCNSMIFKTSCISQYLLIKHFYGKATATKVFNFEKICKTEI